MPSTTLKLRLDTEQLENWRREAEKAGLSLSAWIRGRCDLIAFKDAAARVQQKLAEFAEPVKESKRSRKSEFAEDVAKRTRHEVGCDCFQCVQAERFFRSQRGK